MAGLTKEHARIINYVEAQGVTVTRTTKGLLFRAPNNETTILHWTESDWRATRNFRANLKRMGIEYPGDYQKAKYKNPPQKISIERVQDALKDLDPTRVTTQELYTRIGQMNTSTITRVMIHLGWWHEYKKPTSKRPVIWHPPVDPKEVIEPVEDMQLVDYTDPNEIEMVQEFNDAQKVVMEIQQENEKQRLNRERDKVYADTDTMTVVRGWTVDLDGLDGTVTIDQLRMLYMATGLNVEIRVWKA